MAREKAVTRTVKGTTAYCKQFDLDKSTMIEAIITGIPTSLKTEKDIAAYCEKSINRNPKRKFLFIEKTEAHEDVYGMKFDDFMKYAVKLTSDRKFPDGTSADED